MTTKEVLISLNPARQPDLDFTLKVPTELSPAPLYIVELPLGHTMEVFKYSMSVGDDRPEVMIDGWRYEVKGPAGAINVSREGIRYAHIVGAKIKELAKELLTQHQRGTIPAPEQCAPAGYPVKGRG